MLRQIASVETRSMTPETTFEPAAPTPAVVPSSPSRIVDPVDEPPLAARDSGCLGRFRLVDLIGKGAFKARSNLTRTTRNWSGGWRSRSRSTRRARPAGRH